ncbi:hypothetical protein BGX30_008493, partial [Mortierella sp. GBA39]
MKLRSHHDPMALAEWGDPQFRWPNSEFDRLESTAIAAITQYTTKQHQSITPINALPARLSNISSRGHYRKKDGAFKRDLEPERHGKPLMGHLSPVVYWNAVHKGQKSKESHLTTTIDKHPTSEQQRQPRLIEICAFSGAKIYPGKGKIYVRIDNRSFRFVN